MELAFVPGKFLKPAAKVTGFGTTLTLPVLFPTQFACSRASGNICDVQMKANKQLWMQKRPAVRAFNQVILFLKTYIFSFAL